MEPLKSQLSLRSLDGFEGRPSGTGRSSLSNPGDATQTRSGFTPFADWLDRGLTGGSRQGGASIAERTERRVEDQVAGRIRALSPGPSASRSIEQREAERAEVSGAAAHGEAARAAGAARREARASDRGDARVNERSRERDASSGGLEAPSANDAAASEPAAPAPKPEPAPRALDGHARALTATDASDVDGSSADMNHTPVGNGVDAPVASTGATSAAALTGPPAGLVAAPGAASGGPVTNANLPPAAGAAPGPKATTAAAKAAAAAPPAQAHTAEELELAETVMRQLRARIQLGGREATIELRPSELGRIGVRLKFEDGALTATIRAERPETLKVLAAHAPELRAWLAQDGVEVRDLDLGLADEGRFFDLSSHGDPRSQHDADPNASDRDGPRARDGERRRDPVTPTTTTPTRGLANEHALDIVV